MSRRTWTSCSPTRRFNPRGSCILPGGPLGCLDKRLGKSQLIFGWIKSDVGFIWPFFSKQSSECKHNGNCGTVAGGWLGRSIITIEPGQTWGILHTFTGFTGAKQKQFTGQSGKSFPRPSSICWLISPQIGTRTTRCCCRSPELSFARDLGANAVKSGYLLKDDDASVFSAAQKRGQW